MSFRDCLWTLFYCHNETGNIWTHLIGLFIFVALFIRDFLLSNEDLHHRLVTVCLLYPQRISTAANNPTRPSRRSTQGGYLAAAMYCMGSSATFHLVGPVSRRAYDTALRCDLMGIAVVIAASFFVGLHYGYWSAAAPPPPFPQHSRTHAQTKRQERVHFAAAFLLGAAPRHDGWMDGWMHACMRPAAAAGRCHPDLGLIYFAIVGILSLCPPPLSPCRVPPPAPRPVVSRRTGAAPPAPAAARRGSSVIAPAARPVPAAPRAA